MSDTAAAPAEAARSPLSPSAGALLRQAREAAGLHIGALSVSLKVPVKKLEALEADRHDLLPDAVFARALASSVCRTLKVDPGPILNQLPEQVMPRLQLESSTTDRKSLHPPRALWRAPLLARLPRPVVTLAALLLVGALALYLLPSMPAASWLPWSGSGAPITAEAGAPPAAADVAAPAGATMPASGAASAVPGAAARPTSDLLPGAALAAAIAASGPGGASSAGSLLLFTARGASWVEVTDSAGVLQLRKILNPGDTVPVSGALPLSVVVGRADAIDVLVRGQPFELVSLARDNVARFQIK